MSLIKYCFLALNNSYKWISYFAYFLGDNHYFSSAMTSGQQPDVVPGNQIKQAAIFHDPTASTLNSSEFDKDKISMSALNQG